MTNKCDLIKQYKQNPPEMGIYQIKNKITGKIFIGNAKNVEGILNSHKFQLKMKSHYNKEMQEDYNKYGKDNFIFEKIDNLDYNDDIQHDYTKDLETLEDMWLEKIKPYEEKGYNSRKTN